MSLWSSIFGGKGGGKPNGKATDVELEPDESPKRKKRRTTLLLADKLIADEEAQGVQVEEEDEVQQALDQMRADRDEKVTLPFMESINGLDDVAQAHLKDVLAEETAPEEGEHHDGR